MGLCDGRSARLGGLGLGCRALGIRWHLLKREVELEHALQLLTVTPNEIGDVDERPRKPPLRRRRHAPLLVPDRWCSERTRADVVDQVLSGEPIKLTVAIPSLDGDADPVQFGLSPFAVECGVAASTRASTPSLELFRGSHASLSSSARRSSSSFTTW